MDRKKLIKIEKQLKEMYASPNNLKPKDLISIANKLGRKLSNRGKEPTYTRDFDPELSPPLSIPNHPGNLKPNTARSIVDALLSDVDDWRFYLQEEDDEEY